MNRDGRSSSNHPASEPAIDQSTSAAGGLAAGRPGPGVERNKAYHEDAVNRAAANTTPRRYEQPIEDDSDPVLPANDATVNTKI